MKHAHILYLQFFVQQTTARKVLSTEDRTKRYIVEACLKEARELLCSFQTEERRRHNKTVIINVHNILFMLILSIMIAQIL